MSESLIQMQRRLVRMVERADKLEMALRELVDMCNSDIDTQYADATIYAEDILAQIKNEVLHG